MKWLNISLSDEKVDIANREMPRKAVFHDAPPIAASRRTPRPALTHKSPRHPARYALGDTARAC